MSVVSWHPRAWAESLARHVLALVLLSLPVAARGSEAVADSAFGDAASPSLPEHLLFGSRERQMEFHGFMNFEGFAFEHEADHDKSSFDLHNFFFAGRAPISEEVTLFGEVEYEHGATIRLDRMFVDWRLARWATLRVGRFYVPMSYERPAYWAPVRLFTSRPLLVDIAFHEWADTGFELYGQQGWFGYELLLVNGPFALTENGIPITDVRDNNDGKVPVLRVTAQPVRSLETGASWSRGTYDPADTLEFELFELDARWHRGPLDLWAEYDRRTGDDEPAPTGGPADNPLYTGDRAGKNGFYAIAAYEVVRDRPNIHYLKPMLRFDHYETPGAGDEQQRWTFGLNWSPQPHFVIKSEYQWLEEVRGPERKNNGLMGSFVVDF